MKRVFRKLTALLLVFVLVFGTASTFAAAVPPPRPGHWAEEAINYWRDYGLLDVLGDGITNYNDFITRAEFVALIATLFGYQEYELDFDFPDVGLDNWFYKHVLLATGEGIIRGYADGTFRPGNFLNRAYTAIIMSRVLYFYGEPSSGALIYNDASRIPRWAADAIGVATDIGLMQGFPCGNFIWDGILTYAQAISLLRRVFQHRVTEGIISRNITGTLFVAGDNVTLRNMTIDGDLFITQSSPYANVTLENVTVTGRIIITGGGTVVIDENSIVDNQIIVQGSAGDVVIYAPRYFLVGACNQDRVTIIVPTPTPTPVPPEATPVPPAAGTPQPPAPPTLAPGTPTPAPTLFIVTFNANGGLPVPPPQEVAGGQLATLPTPPTRAGYNFMGWYADAAFMIPWNFATDVVTAATTLFARWQVPGVPEIELSQVDPHEFNAPAGYTTIFPLTVTIYSVGTADATGITVALIGPDAADFIVTQAVSTSLAPNATTTFTVVPGPGLPPGIYTATVQVTADDGIVETFEIVLTVLSSDLRERAQLAWERPETRANVISSQVIELFLHEIKYCMDNVADASLFAVSSLFDSNFATPVQPYAIHHRFWSEVGPYQYNWIWQQNDMFILETTFRVYLILPAGVYMTPGMSYTVTVGGAVLTGTAWENTGKIFETKFDMSTPNVAIHVNQEAYLTYGNKIALLSWWTGDNGDDRGDGESTGTGSVNFAKYAGPGAFHLINESTNQIVFTGDINFRVSGADERWGKADLWELDFTSFTTEGTYHIYIPGLGTSFSFQIGDQAFRDTVGYTVFRGLLHQRDGDHGLNDPDVTHWQRPPGNMGDATIASTGVQIDLTVGHMDAGDRGQYPANVAAVSISMLAANLLFPENIRAFGDNLNLPESGDGIPDFINELWFEVEWLRRAVYYTSIHGDFGGALPHFLRPANAGYQMGEGPEGAMDRVFFDVLGGVSQVTRTNTVHGAGALAMAYNCQLMQHYFDYEVMSRFLEAALIAFDVYWDNRDAAAGVFWQPGSGASAGWARIIAGANLYIATGEQRFNDLVMAEIAAINAMPLGILSVRQWGWHIDGHWPNAFLSLTNTGGNYQFPQATQDWGTNALITWADMAIFDAGVETGNRRWEAPYGAPMPWDGTIQVGWYFSGSIVGYPMMLAYGVGGNARHRDTLENIWNYLMGTNPTNRSFVTGLGAPQNRSHFLVHEIGRHMMDPATPWNWVALPPGTPTADVQDREFVPSYVTGSVPPFCPDNASRWGANHGHPWPVLHSQYDTSIGENRFNDWHAPLWRFNDIWNVQNEFIISNISRMSASLAPLLGSFSDAERSAAISLDRNSLYQFNAVEGVVAADPLTVNIASTGFYDVQGLSVAITGTGMAMFTHSAPAAFVQQHGGATSFVITPDANATVGTHTATVIVSGTNIEPREFDIVLNVVAPEAAIAVFTDDGVLIAHQSVYAFPETPFEYAVPVLDAAVHNIGSTAVIVNSIALTAGTNFTLGALTMPQTIAMGSDFSFTVTPAANLAIGGHTDTVTIVTACGITYTFNVSFEVVPLTFAIELLVDTVAGIINTAVDITGQTYVMGALCREYINTQSRSRLTVTVRNSGNGTVNNLAVALAPLGDFTILTALGATTLAPGATTTFTIQIDPDLDIDDYSTVITVTGDAGVTATSTIEATVASRRISRISGYDFSRVDYDIATGEIVLEHEGSGFGMAWWPQPCGLLYFYEDDLTGNQIITARFDGLSVGSGDAVGVNSVTGLMVRASNAPNAPYFGIFLRVHGGSGFYPAGAGNNLVIWNARRESVGAGVILGNYPPAGDRWPAAPVHDRTVPLYLRIVINGNVFTSYTSLDGNTWTQFATYTDTLGTLIPTGSSFNAGLVVAPTNAGGSVRAVFRDFDIQREAIHELSLSQNNLRFPAAMPTDALPAPATITVTNTGDLGPATGLTIATTGANAGSFTVSALGATTLAEGANTTFTVVPNASLPIGIHVATVTVTCDDGASVTLNVSFAVQPFRTADVNLAPSAAERVAIGRTELNPNNQNVTIGVNANAASFSWGSMDVFHQAYVGGLTGNHTITARLGGDFRTDADFVNGGPEGIIAPPRANAGFSPTDPRTGVIMRATTGATPLWVGIFVNPNGRVQMLRRTSGTNAEVAGEIAANPANLTLWFRLVKVGDNFTGYTSPDGVTWTALGTASIPLGTFTAGLAVSAQSWGTNPDIHNATALFTDITWPTTVTPGAGVISLNQTTNHTFAAAQFGYAVGTGSGEVAPLAVTITNTGGTALTNVDVQLSGTNASSFTILANSPWDPNTTINSAANAGFTVRPNTGLAVGTYTATVTVSATGVTSRTFNVSFEVTAAGGAPAFNFADIGNYNAPGSYTNVGGVITITSNAAAPFPFSANNNLTFAYVDALTGNHVLVTRIDGFSNSNHWSEDAHNNARAGIIVRETGAVALPAYVAINVDRFGNVRMSTRLSGNVNITNTAVHSTEPWSRWLMLVKTGTDVVGYVSDMATPDRNNLAHWNVVATQSFAPAEFDMGLFVSGYNPVHNAIVTFSNVTWPTAAPPETLSIGALAGTTHTFTAVTPHSVTITNTGSTPVTNVNVVLSGAGAGSFTIAATSPWNPATTIAAGATASFTIVPNSGLAVGTHTATVTISGDGVANITFTVSFVVTTPPLPFSTAATGTYVSSNITYNAVTSVVTLAHNARSGLVNWPSADGMAYAFHGSLTGDHTIVARLDASTFTALRDNIGDPLSMNSHAGIMIRQSTAANAPFFGVFLRMDAGAWGASMAIHTYARTSEGGTSVRRETVAGGHPRNNHLWMRVVREGNEYRAYISTATTPLASDWVLVDTLIDASLLTGNFTAGLAAIPMWHGSEDTLVTVSFNNFTVTAGVPAGLSAPLAGSLFDEGYAPENQPDYPENYAIEEEEPGNYQPVYPCGNGYAF